MHATVISVNESKWPLESFWANVARQICEEYWSRAEGHVTVMTSRDAFNVRWQHCVWRAL